MCWRSSSDFHLYGRTGTPGRSVFGWLLDLWRARRPQVTGAEVVAIRAEAAAHIDHETDRKGSKAA